MENSLEDKKIFTRHKCGTCGKVVYTDVNYRYKKQLDGKVKYFCCRDCMEKHTWYKGPASEANKIVIREEDKARIKFLYFEKGKSIEEISTMLGYIHSTVSSFCMKCIEDYPGGK